MSEEQAGTGQLASRISNTVVRAIADATGRGPTRARTTISRDSIFVVIEDTLAKGERTLVDAGDEATVLRMREAWQRAMHPSLNTEIEQLTGRLVIGFMSTNHIQPDLGVEVFILEPSDTDGRISEGESGRPVRGLRHTSWDRDRGALDPPPRTEEASDSPPDSPALNELNNRGG
jgi:uncharacterized protein YbcI